MESRIIHKEIIESIKRINQEKTRNINSYSQITREGINSYTIPKEVLKAEEDRRKLYEHGMDLRDFSKEDLIKRTIRN